MNAKPLALATLLLGVATTFAQRTPLSILLQTNQKQPVTSCYDALRLDGKPIDYTNFSIVSRGIVTIVPGKSETECAVPVPFRIYLSRNGQVIQQGLSDTTRSVMNVEVASVLAIAKIGDDLVVESIQKGSAAAKRAIRIKPLFTNDLFSFLRTGKDGC